MTPRLPTPGGDKGNWGTILNDYLAVAHKTDGTLKDNSIPEAALAPTVQAKLNSGGGTPGATGAQGPQGANGSQGATGPQGPIGPSGASGTQGATGAQGPAGVAGQPGATGTQGIQGPAGASGTPGANGQPGAVGATGPQGPAGTPSTVPGPQGATGPQGEAGADGADGTSVTITGSVANAAALPVGLTPADAGKGYITEDNGHLHVWGGTSFTDVGTVRGPEGPQGAMGTAGTNGATGATGPQGPAGAAGTQGATGATGTAGQAGATGAQGATGPAGATTIAGISGLQTALDSKVTTSVTMSTVPGGSQFSRNITYALATDNPDIAQIAINGIVTQWNNEWGAMRGTSPYNWGDSLVRAIRSTGDGISDGTGSAGSGRALELVDRRINSPPNITTSEHLTPANVMWGVRWKDGRMVQGGAMVGAVYVLNANQTAADIPASLPAGTLIVRKRAA